MRTVELLPGPEFEACIRGLWQRLSDAGLPSLGDHPHPTNRPHLTLTEAAELPGAALRELLTAGLPVPVATGAIGLWTGRRGVTLHLVVVPSPQLIELHRRVCELVTEPAEHHLPGRWSPHLTLALRLPAGLVGDALTALGAETECHGELVAARSYTSVERTVEQLTSGPA